METKVVEILEKREIFGKAFFHWFSVRFRYRKFDGGMSAPAEHLVLDRGDSIAVLMHDLLRNEVILVEQFRVATCETSSGWLLEIPAGRIDEGEDPRDAAIRETKEETGAKSTELQFVFSFYLSPGGCSEKLHLFYCPFAEGLEVQAHGGLANEGEDLKVHRISVSDAMDKVLNGDICDAKTVIALQWLAGRSPGSADS